jgi:hypothetical protein
MKSIDRCGGMVFVENSERSSLIINLIFRVVLRDNKYFQPESGHTVKYLTSKFNADGIVVPWIRTFMSFANVRKRNAFIAVIFPSYIIIKFQK